MIWVLAAFVILALVPVVREWRRLPMDDKARQNANGAFADLPRGATYYQWLGAKEGPVAVCVHGLTTPSYVFHGLAEGLGELGYRVLVYDHFGRGYSDRPKGLQDAEFFVSSLEGLLESQGVTDDITLIGYSMGGGVVAAFGAKNPSRLRRLILLAPGGMGHDLGLVAKFMQFVPVLGRWLMHMVYPRVHRIGCEEERDLPSSVAGIVDLQIKEQSYRGFIDAVQSSLRGMLGADTQAMHGMIRRAGVPVLAIWGKDDTVVPITASEVLAQWNGAAQNEIIEGAGHGVPYTHTKEVLAAIAKV